MVSGDAALTVAEFNRNDRFAFGENWAGFLSHLDDQRIVEAERSLQWLLGRERLDGLTFLDIGSGSGLSSLAARRLGAHVRSFDYDPQSVECTRLLRDRYFSLDAQWEVESGSVLDPAYLSTLGHFDIVYSWGVLHHTGAMYRAIELAAERVKPDGFFVFALYRATRLCWFWRWEKRWYMQASPALQTLARFVYLKLRHLSFIVTNRSFARYTAEYLKNRGMEFGHDVHDWMGGYPYESVRPAQVADEMKRLGFTFVRDKVQPYSLGLFGSGCDEYVYRRMGG
jgi:2-polyprenyl-3-methyl-5-hydroxy-6-metoxy-1,4-benzoquinol methylase